LENGEMKIQIAMQYDEAYAAIGALSSYRARQYAQKHGYQLHIYPASPINGETPSWAKVRTVYAAVIASVRHGFFDYVFWLDADTLILNLERPIDTIVTGLAMDVSQDYNGLCAGVFGVQANHEGMELMRTWYFLGQVADEKEFGNPGLEDQATLMLLDRKFPKLHRMIGRIPESIVANQDSHASAPFIYHYWARGKNKIEVFTSMMRDAENTAP
jgi:hypothetical protein